MSKTNSTHKPHPPTPHPHPPTRSLCEKAPLCGFLDSSTIKPVPSCPCNDENINTPTVLGEPQSSTARCSGSGSEPLPHDTPW